MATKNSPYNASFYEGQASGSYKSALRILPIVLGECAANSMVDFGCGIGTWLRAALDLGVSEVRGLDGDYVPFEKLMIPREYFQPHNLEQHRIKLDKKYDLAMSLEVAEHLSFSRSSTFVEDLCAAADHVLFSAAIPGDGGVNHINEQWQSFWIELFRKNRFACYDIIRPRVWEDDVVEYFYRQNTFYFKRATDNPIEVPNDVDYGHMYDVVHPKKWESMLADHNLQHYLRTSIASMLPRPFKAFLKQMISKVYRN